MTSRLADVAVLSPDVAFLQECLPPRRDVAPARSITPGTVTRPSTGTPGTNTPGVIARVVGPRKSVALCAANAAFTLEALARPRNVSRASLAAAVTGPVAFNVIGVWAQGANYAADVLRTIRAYRRVIRSGPTVVMGDFNIGADLRATDPPATLSRGHAAVLDLCASLELVSAYHAFHRVDHGRETHATYRHLFNAARPWHIDFCFVPQPWARSIASVTLASDDTWNATSDHHPLMVEIDID
ncbi:MAG: endonuclease/exonuclease/phosphatase family protein [Acidobacteria bacterium]|nr:endonuclease/exonuclease/phosphatase family protein [Acidobacteriota bacterium]